MRTLGQTILGADDRAGLTVILYMIAHCIPGRYCMFFGEERGCVGSKQAAVEMDWTGIDRMVSFDRGGYNDVITHQCGTRTCSNDFGKDLAQQLNWHGDFSAGNGGGYDLSDEGVFTDSDSFSLIIPECTNVSVGYGDAHSIYEWQNLNFLDTLCRAVVEVDWDNLPTVRDPSVYDSLYSDYKWRGLTAGVAQWRGHNPSDKSIPNCEYFGDDREEGNIYVPLGDVFSRIELALIFGNDASRADVQEAVISDPRKLKRLLDKYDTELNLGG